MGERISNRWQSFKNKVVWFRNRLFVVLGILLVLLAIGYAFFRVGPHAIVGGSVTDIITNVDPLANGYYLIWVFSDVESAYCTNNREFVDIAMQLKEWVVEATMTYDSINFGDLDSGPFGCNASIFDVETDRLTSIREHEERPAPPA